MQVRYQTAPHSDLIKMRIIIFLYLFGKRVRPNREYLFEAALNIAFRRPDSCQNDEHPCPLYNGTI